MLIRTSEHIEKKRTAAGAITIIAAVSFLFVVVTVLGLAQMA